MNFILPLYLLGSYVLIIFILYQDINEDIQDHNEPIQQVAQDALALIKAKGKKMTEDNKRDLEDAVEQLKSRYDVINRNSTDRTNKITFGFQDLDKIEEGCGEFETWLRSAEQEIIAILRNISSDYDTLTRQTEEHQNFTDDVVTHSADLKYMNKATQKFLSTAKVSYQNRP